MYTVRGCGQPFGSPLSNICFGGGIATDYGPTIGNELYFEYLSYGTITPNGRYIYDFMGARLTTATLHFTDGSTFDFVPLIPDKAECQPNDPSLDTSGFYTTCEFLNYRPMSLPGGPPRALVVSYVDIVADIDEGYDVPDGNGGRTSVIGTRQFRSTVTSVRSTGLVAPEPATFALVGGGLLLLGGVASIRRRA